MEVREGGRHTIVRLNGRITAVPRHAVDLKIGTFRAVQRDLGLTKADLEE